MLTGCSLEWCYLGRVAYQEALSLQGRLRQEIVDGLRPDTLLLLEHPPVITLGRRARREHLLCDEAELARLGVELVSVERGGDITYHGPGQLVGYPLRRVDRAVKAHVDGMAGALRTLLGRMGIEASFSDEHPGLWTARGKVAAVGVDARGGVAMHGFALNVTVDLSGFSLIVPCGLRAPVTSLRELLGHEPPPLEALATELADSLGQAYGARVVPISADDLFVRHRRIAP